MVGVSMTAVQVLTIWELIKQSKCSLLGLQLRKQPSPKQGCYSA